MKLVTIACAAAMLGLTAAPAPGDAALDLALSKPVASLSIPSAPIGEVLTKLTQSTGVKFLIDDETLSFLPMGAQTRLEVKLRDISLRDALSQILASSGLQWTVEGSAIRISPSDPLWRLSRRATFDELEILKLLQTGKLQTVGAGAAMLEQLRIQTHEPDLKIVYKVPGVTDESIAPALAAAQKQLPASPARFLDALTATNDLTWYLSGKDIVILSRKDQVERQLQRQVSLRYKNEQLVTVLKDLARQAHVQLELAPGVLAAVPIEMRTNYTLVMADATIAQTLEIISGMTGLAFKRTSSGILVEPSAALAARSESQPASAGGKRPFMVRLTMKINGQDVEVFMRSDELPDDVVETIQAEKAKFIEQIRAGKPSSTRASIVGEGD